MESIRQWAFSICCAMVACGIAQMLLPKSNMEKMFRICISVFFLCCLLSPLFLRNPDLRIEIQEISQKDIENRVQRLSIVLDEQTGMAAGVNLEKIVAQNLHEMGINDTSITIHITTVGQHDPVEPVVEIILDREHEERHDEIRSALKDALGLEVRLGYQ